MRHCIHCKAFRHYDRGICIQPIDCLAFSHCKVFRHRGACLYRGSKGGGHRTRGRVCGVSGHLSHYRKNFKSNINKKYSSHELRDMRIVSKASRPPLSYSPSSPIPQRAVRGLLGAYRGYLISRPPSGRPPKQCSRVFLGFWPGQQDGSQDGTTRLSSFPSRSPS